MDAHLKKVLDAQTRTVTVLSSLIAVQEAMSHLPPESIPAVAEYTGASVNEVYGVATFYTHFRFEPPGEHSVEVCWGPTCQLFDSRGLMRVAEESTGTSFDEPTLSRVPSCSTRSSFTWTSAGKSPTSSRKSVPREACSKRPTRRRSAPVNAPRS